MLKTRFMAVGLIVLAASLLLIGSTAILAAKTVNLDQSQSGGSVTLNTGDTLNVVLSQQTGSTGYSWSLVSLTPAGVLTSLGHQITPGQGIGGVGTDTWTFSASSTGTCQIDLEYRRGTGESARSFTQTVLVNDSAPPVPASSNLSLYLMIGAFATTAAAVATRRLKTQTRP
jgi:predicted secreted protein